MYGLRKVKGVTISKVLEAAERREALIDEIKVRLFAARTSREAQKLEDALREALNGQGVGT